ncbi:MAG: hypothetical protein WBB74_06130 [Gaiellaceae bacterium]
MEERAPDAPDVKATLKMLDRVRRGALKSGDRAQLDDVLERAHQVGAQATGGRRDSAVRLAYTVEQNIEFIERNQAIAAERGAARERGFGAALRFYQGHFRSVFVLSLSFYLAMVALAVLSVVTEPGFLAVLTVLYLIVVSIFWLQAPLARLMDDVRAGRQNAGVRRTFASLSPRMGAITRGSFLAAVGIYIGWFLLIVPGLILLARWALLIPVIVLEGMGARAAFARSNQLVRRHTGRVVVEILISAVLMLVVWSIALALLMSGPGLWLSVIALLFLALVTPPIPLMRVLSYYDLVEAAAKVTASQSPPPGPKSVLLRRSPETTKPASG